MEAINLNIEGKLQDNLKLMEKIEKKIDENLSKNLGTIKETVDESRKILESHESKNTIRWADMVKRSDASVVNMEKVNVAIHNSAKVHSNFDERE